MAKNYRLTPDGTGDRLFEACEAEARISGRLAGVFEGAGYRKVRTPGLEFLSVFEGAGAYFPPEEMYKLSDGEGRMVALRPDSTIPIARLVATKLKGAELPLRLYYSQSVFRRQPEHRGRESEVTQMGVEFIGEAGFSADVDMIDLAARSLSAVYGGRFRIEIGHVGLYKRLMERLGGDEELLARIHRYVNSKNYSALEEALMGVSDRETAELIMRLPGLFGGMEALSEAEALFCDYDGEITEMLGYLARVMEELSARGHADVVMIDLGLVGRSEYYTSLVFKGYGDNVGEPLLSGGRYDELFCDFGEDLPATGFGVNIDLLIEADLAAADADGPGPAKGGGDPQAADGSAGGAGWSEQGSEAGDGGGMGAGGGCAVGGGRSAGEEAKTRPLRIALTKGRLEEGFTALMEKAGYDMRPLRDKGRKLIIPLMGPGGGEEGAVELFLAKAPDVVTSVEHGVCEVGIVGKDTLLEQGGTYYEIMDLGLGKCRFALAAPAGGAVARGAAPRVVASKYPQYTGRYFERLGLDVRIIRIEGSVEIAPLLELADSIVDLVQTGDTMRENNLDVVTYIRDISARLIVNMTGMKLRKHEVEALATALKVALAI